MRYIRGFALAMTLALLVGLAGPGQAQKALKIFMVPKFTGAAYFAATEKGAKEAVAELKAVESPSTSSTRVPASPTPMKRSA